MDSNLISIKTDFLFDGTDFKSISAQEYAFHSLQILLKLVLSSLHGICELIFLEVIVELADFHNINHNLVQDMSDLS